MTFIRLLSSLFVKIKWLSLIPQDSSNQFQPDQRSNSPKSTFIKTQSYSHHTTIWRWLYTETVRLQWHFNRIRVKSAVLQASYELLWGQTVLFFVDSSSSVEELPAGCEWSCFSCRLCGSRQTLRIQDWTRCKIKHHCFKLYPPCSTGCCLLTADWWWLHCSCVSRLS